MSLRLKLIALFAAVLALTMGVAAWLGGRIAASTVQDEIRDRTIETGHALAAELARAASYDPKATTDRLAELIRSNPGLRAAELAVERPGPDQIMRVEMTPHGVETQVRDDPAEVPAHTETTLVEGPQGRYWSVSLPARVGRSRARVTLESSLAEADSVVEKERGVFVEVTAFACVFLILVANLLLIRLIGRPIEALSTAMSEVERGNLDASVAERGQDELARLARGFNEMLTRIRGFNQELTTRIDAAVADVARKNHALEELNDLLVAARRDLTAKERLAALGQLSGTLAHELGNPLNVISGNLQLLARSRELPEATREEVQQLQDEVARMTGIIRRFLDSTRGLKPDPERVEVKALLAESLDLSLSADARTRIQVQTELEPGLESAVIDPGLVRHVLTNFISNAVDAMAEHGSLTVGARRDSGDLVLWVRDTGSGITAPDRKHIFEPFFTTKPKGKGTGLGLAICREIALALKGRIDVESTPNAGSTFALRIPIPAETEASGPVASPQVSA
ncbi:MAG: HAMP domain-containing protein [Deltaproteobacteria bacterium]|nr:HAMP domain-containing protein [Deltaproteobacteria bacterium]